MEFTWNDPRESLLEAVLSRGDRRLGAAIYRAWQLGAKFDAWSEYHDWRIWERAFAETGIDAAWYAYRERDLWETLPWAHIDSGVNVAYLRREWHEHAEQGKDARLPPRRLQRLRHAEPAGRAVPRQD